MEVVANKIPKLRFPNFQGDWKNKQLKEVGQVVNGLTYSPENIKENGVLVLRSSNIQNGSLAFDDNVYVDVEDFNPVEKNDILICVRNGSRRLIGKNALITEDISGVAFGAFMTVFRSEINEFIFQLFSTSNYYKTIHQNLGATINSINNGDLKKFRFSFPSQNEQQKIASFLSSVDKKLDQLQKKKELLEQYKKGMMQKIFKQEIRFKDEHGKDFPKWEEKKLKDSLKSYRLGGNYSNSDKVTEKPLIKMGNLGRGKITLSKIQYIEEGVSADNEDLIQKDDLFFNTRNTLELVGKVAIWRNELPKAYYNSNLMRLRFDNNSFMNYRLNSYDGIKGLKRYATGTTSVAAIYTRDLLKLKLKIPCVEEQSKIANFLSALDEKIDLVATEIEKASHFKKGLLQQMFV